MEETETILSRLLQWLRRLFGQLSPPVPPQPAPCRVSLIIIDPVLSNSGGRRLSRVLGWNDPDLLVREFVRDLTEVSHGGAQYTIVERIEVDEFPVKEDGFRYTEEEYLRVVRTWQGMHRPDEIDYYILLHECAIIDKINAGLIDEVWTVSFPWAGFFESRMAGPGAYWCNAPPLPMTDSARRRFIIMGFNYERGVGEMLESYGHRAESILTRVFNDSPPFLNFWEKFTRYDLKYPSQAEVGNVHFAPNSRRDYDWGNPAPVLSRCRAWRNFPDLSAEPQKVDCSEWGGGDIRAHHRWLFSLMPHFLGETSGILHNWWAYIVDPNLSSRIS